LKFTAFALFAVAAVSAQTNDRIQQSIPVQNANRLALIAEVGSIQILPGAGSSVEVEVYFDGNASRQEFDRMLKDFTLDVTRPGADLRVEGRFRTGWKERSFFRGWNFHSWCNNGRCLEYTWLRRLEYRVKVPASFSAEARTSGGSIEVGDLKGSVNVGT